VNARRSPKRVLDTHLPDQRTDFSLYLRSPCFFSFFTRCF
jgi:hypothetical protein